MSAATGVPPVAPKKKNKVLIGCLIAGGAFLCLVVPITGVLLAIAIPNFQKYKCKSLQSEAKMNLKSLQIGEQVFYGEHASYTTDLKAIEFRPFGRPHYLYGFAESGPGSLRKSDAPADYDESRQSTAALDGVDKSAMTTRGGSTLTVDDLPADTFAEREHFAAGAAGDIKGNGVLDVWTVDEKGNPRNVFDACSGRAAD